MDGVNLSELKKIANPKGNIFHALKSSDNDFIGFGEAYFSDINKNEIKGWKRHKQMQLNIVVVCGRIKFVVYDESKNEFFTCILSLDNYFRLTIESGLYMAFMGLDNNNKLINIASIEHDPTESENRKLNEISYNRAK